LVIPVYQCAERLPEHVECLRRLRPMVHEFIWVITESSDGSHQLAQKAAQELGGHVLEVPRGLYEAWNSGIARATGEFIYISTVGDTITVEGLNALSVCLQINEADVVFSPPVISPLTQANLKRSRHWPVFRFAQILNKHANSCIPKQQAILIQILSGASGLLGSCASCLFRSSFLQSRPFPTDHHHYGDTAWTYQHLPEATLSFHPNPVAKFVIHNVETSRTVDKRQIYRLIDQLAIQLSQGLTQIAHKYTRASFHIDRIRDPHPKFGWWWMPAAWKARWIRNKSSRGLLKHL
jgi:hypothetical protein